MKLGMDFGSTITILSTYRDYENRLDALELDSAGNNANIPSYVCQRGDKLSYGSAAKRLTGRKNCDIYRAFKMLLMEENRKFVKSRGYDDTHTPAWAAETFFRAIMEKADQHSKAFPVEKLVVGAPDVWFHSFATLGGRAVVHDICSRIEGMGDVRIVSEPILATAYFAYNYMKKKKKPYEGYILIVDYGGGTLDLSLTQVSKGTGKTGQSMEIRLRESNGAGENTDHSVGNAAIVYMESLTEYVLRKHDPEGADDLIGTPAFDAAVIDVEHALLENAAEIEKNFIQLKDRMSRLEKKVLEEIDFDGDVYPLTYADMVNVYNDKIRGVFQEKMDEIIKWAKDDGIDLMDSNSEQIKLALVGGFGGFYLVEKQMKETFRWASTDIRWNDIIEDRSDCERAISYGAALVAADVVGICNTAPFSIGLQSKVGDKKVVEYMAEYKSEIDLYTPYYISDQAGNPKPICIANNALSDFQIDYGRGNQNVMALSVKPEFKERLSGLVKNPYKTCCLGISFDQSDVMSLHVKEFNMMTFKPEGKATVIELGKPDEVFVEINKAEKKK